MNESKLKQSKQNWERTCDKILGEKLDKMIEEGEKEIEMYFEKLNFNQ